MAWSFCTKAQVISIRPYSLDKLEDWWSDSVEQLIKDFMGAKYLGVVQAITGELHDGEDLPLLIPKHPPVLSVQGIRISSSTLSPLLYNVLPNHIIMLSGVFPTGQQNIAIDYTSGGDVDAAVTLAATTMICAIINYRERYGADSSIRWSTSDMEVGDKTPNLNVGLTSHLVQIMKRLLKRERVKVH